MNTKTIYVVIGTRAQLVKMAPIMNLLQKEGIPYTFIYTAQHKETINNIIKDFNIKEPDKTLYNRKEANTFSKFLGWSGEMILNLFQTDHIFSSKGFVLTHGDTATAAWAAIAGKIAGCSVGHVESGLRSYNIFNPFPEELMRLITFKFSDVYFCPNDWAVKNLKNYTGKKINLMKNPLYDSVKHALKKNINFEKPSRKYVVVSLHRYENIFTNKFEAIIIPLLEKIADNILLLFVLHPSTREVLKKNNGRLYKRLENNKNILLKKRYPFTSFIKLLSFCEFAITDGGSNQEELSYLGKPTLLFRKVTERIEGLDKNIVISNFDENLIGNFISIYKSYNAKVAMNSEISPSSKVVDFIKNEILS